MQHRRRITSAARSHRPSKATRTHRQHNVRVARVELANLVLIRNLHDLELLNAEDLEAPVKTDPAHTRERSDHPSAPQQRPRRTASCRPTGTRDQQKPSRFVTLASRVAHKAHQESKSRLRVLRRAALLSPLCKRKRKKKKTPRKRKTREKNGQSHLFSSLFHCRSNAIGAHRARLAISVRRKRHRWANMTRPTATLSGDFVSMTVFPHQ